MTTQTQIKSETKPDEQKLYNWYLAPVFDLAAKIDPQSAMPQLAVSSALNNPAFISHLAVVTDVILESYLQQLKRLPTNQIVAIIGLLHDCSHQNAENEPFIWSEELHLIQPHVDCLSSELVEQIIEEMDDSSVFKTRPFILYYALTIMQLSIMLNGPVADEDDQLELFGDIRLCIDRARTSLKEFLRKKEPTHKQLAILGGKKRAQLRHGSAQDYTKKRAENPSEAEMRMSMKKFARKILAEIISQGISGNLAETNRERTVYDWVREYIRLPADV